MYSSPGTPGGVSRPCSSSTCSSVLAIGAPIEIGPSPTSATADQMVVSVGPYMFHSSTPPDRSRRASSAGSASPPASAFSPGAPGQPASSSIRQVDGVAWTTLAPEAASSRDNCSPSAAAPRSATTTRAPVTSGSSSSSSEMSKEWVVTASRVSPAVRPGRSRIERRKFASARCGTCTPLGRPVEPEV